MRGWMRRDRRIVRVKRIDTRRGIVDVSIDNSLRARGQTVPDARRSISPIDHNADVMWTRDTVLKREFSSSRKVQPQAQQMRGNSKREGKRVIWLNKVRGKMEGIEAVSKGFEQWNKTQAYLVGQIRKGKKIKGFAYALF